MAKVNDFEINDKGMFKKWEITTDYKNLLVFQSIMSWN